MGEMLYPIGIQEFDKLRTGGYVYVDKTMYIHELVRTGSYYFLGRPRRFGKSLLISTIEAYFSGKKELFEGLAIEGLTKEWRVYPVLHLDLNTERYSQPEDLDCVLDDALSRWESMYGEPGKKQSLSLRFKNVVCKAAEKTGQKVVILVDEYDKPLIQTILDEKLQDNYRRTLKAFYSVLKTQDKYIKFAFLTGVTKFGKVSVFSDLNNLIDISMKKEFAEICGITEAEIHTYFEDSLKGMAAENGMSYNEVCTKLKEQYDGYHFGIKTHGVYNPFSLLNALRFKNFENYWFETGTPTFLVELLKHHNYNLNNLTKERLTSDVLNCVDSVATNPVPMIYQSGYLTIRDYLPRFEKYLLGFPNKEVETGFFKFLLPAYVPARETSEFDISLFVEDVESGDADGFMQRLQGFFSSANYKIVGDMEKYFQNALYIIFKIMGFYTEVEHNTSHGCVDIVIKTPEYIYVMECKLDKSAKEALEQIESKGYAAPFVKDKRKLYKIGVNFSSGTRDIDDYAIV